MDIESTTIAEYNLYVSKRGLGKNPLNDLSYGFTPKFFAQPQHTPNTPVDKKDFGLDEILDGLFKKGAKNLKRMGQAKIRNGCDDGTSRDTNHESANLVNFPIFPNANEFSSICEQDVDNINDLEKEEAQVEDGDSVDIYDIWDITIEDVKRIRKFFTPNVPDVMDDVIQPLILKTIHTTPADKDYVAPVTK
uniref:Uncharacterized protein n=1 Tax=Tanacetum cinerariifolium TaxID=118510 RepID=A0A699LAM2_TANCI|nr:hypothetical protein [Tanacetum cinerariifolium]